jgi:molybdopterin-guanine dinucleotide biosynthesis adapter protein
MRVAAFTGDSGSGKTTAIVGLIRFYTGQSLRVGAIKHTHHELNEREEGDTAQMRRAGAGPVVLAGDGEAVIFNGAARRVRFNEPKDLLAYFSDCDIVLIEGFRNATSWPRVELASDRRTVTELAANLDRIWRS